MSEEALTNGELSVVGRMPWSSNQTFLVEVTGTDVRAIYKPLDGERRLDDFPPGIYKREIAAYQLSQMFGWPNIPTTIERRDAPFGTGSVQLFVEADFEQHYFTLLDDADLHDSFGDIAVFDIVANNTDRKSGHVLLADGTVYAIDNGLCFNTEPKLRTVVWDFAGSEITTRKLDDLRAARRELAGLLDPWLTGAEIDALDRRIGDLIEHPVLPAPEHQWQFPWPLV